MYKKSYIASAIALLSIGVSLTSHGATTHFTRVQDSLGALNVGTNTDGVLPDGDSIDDTYSSTFVSVSSQVSEYGTRTARAEADLANGSLKAFAAATEFTSTQYASPFASAQALAVAEFGDSFSFVDSGSASIFNWESGDTFTFNLGVTGNLAPSSGLTPLNVNRNQTAIGLVILEKGGLEDYLSGELNQDETDLLVVDSFIEQHLWTFGDDTSDSCALFSFTQSLGCNITNISGTDFDETLSATFSPDGDFDWFLRLAVGGTIFLNNNQARFFADFDNTVNVGFEAPENSITQSSSGLFPNTVEVSAVPLPAAAWIFLSAIGGLVGLRYKNK